MTAFKKSFCFYSFAVTYHAEMNTISNLNHYISILKLVLIIQSWFHVYYLIWASKRNYSTKLCVSTPVLQLLQITYCDFYRSLGTKNLLKKRPWYFIKKETLVQLISCEFCEISENTSFTEHLWATASGYGGTVKIEEFSGTRQKTDDGRK